MLKKKFMSVLLTIAMLTGVTAVDVSADGSADAISAVIMDSTGYTQFAHYWNRTIINPNNFTYHEVAKNIGGDANVSYAAYTGDISKESRFQTAKYVHTTDETGKITSSTYEAIQLCDATTNPMYWSVDVYDNGKITDIQMQSNASLALGSLITSDMLNDNEWNTFSVVYYPNPEDEGKLGYSDFYLNGEFVSTHDLSSNPRTDYKEYRFKFNFTEANADAYFDNIKIYEMTSFTRPTVDTSNVTVKDGKITDYITETRRTAAESKEGSNTKRAAYTISKYDATVKTVKTLLAGAAIINADGTEASDTDNVSSDMKVQETNTITGVGTFTDTYEFYDIAETYVDATDLTAWANGWNRIMGSISNMSVAGDSASSGVHDDNGNTVAAYKLSGTVGTTVSYIKMAECYWVDASSTASKAIDISTATTPIYASIDIYDNDVLTDFLWETGGGADIGTTITKDQLNANVWNTFAVVYYPNLEDTSKLGYADAYLNGKFIGTSDLSGCDAWAYGGEVRLTFKYTAADTAAYFDNHKCYAMTEFVRPDIISGAVTIADGTFTGYGSMTVAELETATGTDIVNADGTNPDADARAAAGMKAIAASAVEGVGTFTTQYMLGTADKVLVSEDFASADSFKTAMSDRIGFGYTRETGGLGSKASDDGYLKMTVTSQDDGSDGTMDSRFAVWSEYITDNTNGRVSPVHGNPLIYSIDIYPQDGVESIQFDTGARAWSQNISANELTFDAWNNITFVFYTTKFSPEIPEAYTWESDMYINGKLISRAYSDYTTPTVSNPLRFHVISEATGTVFYIDNIKVVSTSGFVRPALTSEEYVITETKGKAGTVGGYKGLKVSELKNGAATSGDNVSVSVYNADGTLAEDTAEAVTDMYMTAVTDYSEADYGCSSYTRVYNLESADFDVYAPVGYANGYIDDKFGKGIYRVETDIVYYTSEPELTASLAQYSKDGVELEKKETDYKITESSTVGAEINITKTENTYLKYTLTNKNTGEVYSEKTIYPYDTAVIEKTVKLYKGFTTKAVTFGYDDGVTSDAETVALFNKYGAKATFNLVGKNLAGYYGENFAETVKAQYAGHEIANHTYEHKSSYLMEDEVGSASDGTPLYGCSLEDAIADVTVNSKFLKDNLGVTTRGIAWPNGFPSNNRTDYDELEKAVMEDGHVYARYSENGKFELPSDWMQWAPTCHHKYLDKYTDQFVSLRNEGDIKLYFVWGHSYEFKNAGDDETKNWTLLENTLKKLSNDNIWYATHGEIYDYVNALDKVEIGDYSIKNNSDMTVYLHVNGESVTLGAGEEYKTSPKLYVKADSSNGAMIYTNNVYGTVVAAAYDEYGRFLNADVNEKGSDAVVPTDGAKTVKGFLFKDLEKITPMCEALEISAESFEKPVIVCWGDSLTYGQESTDPATKSYPAVLSRLTGLEVRNMGIGGETATTIAARQGALDIVLTEDIKIPAEGTVEIKFIASNGGSAAPRNVDLGGWNECYIAGVKGRLEATVIRGTDGAQTVSYATFTRTNPGTPIKVKAGEKLVPSANYVRGDINIIFTGTNGGWSSLNRATYAILDSAEYETEIESLIEMQKVQAKLSTNPDKYIILGLTNGTKSQWSKLTEAMEEAFGEHFIDLRAELSNEAVLADAGITPTDEDKAAIAEGAVPPSLLTDGTHYTDAGYELVAKIVYAKLKSLGYII